MQCWHLAMGQILLLRVTLGQAVLSTADAARGTVTGLSWQMCENVITGGSGTACAGQSLCFAMAIMPDNPEIRNGLMQLGGCSGGASRNPEQPPATGLTFSVG